jgi:hypothetical protein
MGLRRILASLVVMSIFASPCLHAQSKEQTVFNAEDAGVKNPVALPPDVLEALKSDSYAADAFREADPSACFSASTIRLGPRVDDLIVEAAGALRGANVNMFWVFLTTPSGHRLVLKAPAHDLIVEKARTHEYHDITIRSGTPVSDDLRFNGKRYALHRERTDGVR